MYQTGDTVELMLTSVPTTGSVIYSYVWDTWDGLTTATEQPFLMKVVNIGGQPGTDELQYRCYPVAIDGQSGSFYGSILANGPPTILPGVSLSANDQFFAYATQLSLSAFEYTYDLPMTFAWYSDGTYLGAGVSVSAGYTSGTWTGNGTQIIESYPVVHNTFDMVVTGEAIVTCYVADTRGGTAHVNFLLRGEPAPAPLATTSAGFANVSFDATTPPTARIGTGQVVDFAVYVPAITGHIISFLWTFSGSNGWTMLPVHEAGTTAIMPNGGYQNVVHRDISTEVVSSGTEKLVTADVRITATSVYDSAMTHTDTHYSVTLIENSAPSSVTVVRKVGTTPITGDGPVEPGDKIEFSAAGTDPNGDVLDCQWRFAQPFDPNPIYLWGPKVLYDTTGYTNGESVEGVLTVTDWLGLSLVTPLPSTTVST